MSLQRARISGRSRTVAAALVAFAAFGAASAVSVGQAAPAGAAPLCGLNSSFGRMFPSLGGASWSVTDLAALADRSMENTHVQGQSLDGSHSPDEMQDFPAGYNYAGQFVDHDIVLDDRPNDLLTPIAVSALVNKRTPGFDLDSLYGAGPAGSPAFYEADGLHFRLGAPLRGAESDHRARDLVRDSRGSAVIGDPRNDENQIVASLHSIFTRFHNRIADNLRSSNPSWTNAQVFAEAKKQTTYSYQWAVLTDFLPKVAGSDITSSVVSRTSAGWNTNLGYYNSCNGSMPIEFAGAAYRFGHSLVRNDYEINELHNNLPVFTSSFNANDSLVGFQPMPQDHAIDWKYFLNLKSSTTPQDAYQFDNSLVPALKLLPGPAAGTQSTVLATRNILRGQQIGLPSGQDVARAMGVTPLRDDQILIGPALGALNSQTTQAITSISPAFAGKAPLWTYVLAEAAFYNHQGQVANGKILTNSRRNPERLGPVGGRIVAETIVGLIKADPNSVLNNPSWTPDARYASWDSSGLKFADIVKVGTGLMSSDITLGLDTRDGYGDFGNGLALGGFKFPVMKSFVVRNASKATVTYGQPTLSGANAASFSVTSNSCSMLPVTSTGVCTVSVNFLSDPGPRFATLTIPSNGANPVVIDLKANTAAPVFTTVS